MTQEIVSQDLKTVLRRLKLGRMLDTLPERFTLARKQQMTHQDFLLLVLCDEASRRDGQAATIRAQRARLDSAMCLERWDETARVHYDKTLLNELASLRFIEACAHVTIVGPVGVGKTFLAHALGHLRGRRGRPAARPAPSPRGCPPSPIRCAPRAPSTASRTTPTTSWSRASRTDRG